MYLNLINYIVLTFFDIDQLPLYTPIGVLLEDVTSVEYSEQYVMKMDIGDIIDTQTLSAQITCDDIETRLQGVLTYRANRGILSRIVTLSAVQLTSQGGCVNDHPTPRLSNTRDT